MRQADYDMLPSYMSLPAFYIYDSYSLFIQFNPEYKMGFTNIDLVDKRRDVNDSASVRLCKRDLLVVICLVINIM